MKTVSSKTVSILGSTGSVGANTVEMIELHNAAVPGTYKTVALTAHENVSRLAEQARRLEPEFVAIANPEKYRSLKESLAGLRIQVGAGPDAVVEAALRNADWLMASIVGAAGLKPTLAAVSRGKTIALANKECLVTAGELFMSEVRRSGALLLPVDSEHNAVFQVFEATHQHAIEQITLTASGGPFRTWSLDQMKKVTPAQACKHPNYAMGAKISVDSASLMNKGLELIEAHHLFGTSPERLAVVIHPQQAVHCLVTYSDGSVLAQLASPDMRTPIAYSLGYPARINAPTRRLNLAELGQLTFETPDTVRFPCLKLAQEALRSGNGAATILNAANEVAVEAFLAEKLGFSAIASIVEEALNTCLSNAGTPTTVEHALALDSQARQHAKRALQN